MLHNLFCNMPITYNGLVVENTSRCNAKCAICYQYSSPKGSDLWGKAKLSISDLEPVIREALSIGTLRPRFHLSGGEAFIDIKSAYRIFELARDSGFVDITATTNAYWAKNPGNAEKVCNNLRRVDVTELEISWDYWHRPYVSAEAVSNCLMACRAAGIETNLRILTTRVHLLSKVIEDLHPTIVNFATRITSGPVFPTGRAADTISKEEFFGKDGVRGNCHTYLNLTINSLGNVYPCCAGFDQTPYFSFGNIRDKSIVKIAEYMDSSLLLRTIVFKGIGTLLPIIKEAGIDLGQDYKSICHLCWRIFSMKECTEAIIQYFKNRTTSILSEAVNKLESKIKAKSYNYI